MTQRNPMNPRNQERPKGKTRKSASSAKLVRPAGASVSVTTDRARKKQKDKERKEKEKAEAAQDRKREALLTVGTQALPEYKKWRRWWVVSLIVAIVCVLASWLASIYGNNGEVSQQFHDLMQPLSIAGIVIGYAAIIFALFIDFKKIRPLRKAQQARAQHLSKSEKRKLDQQIALSEKAQAEQKGAKRRMPWDKKETDAAKHDDADAKDASKKDARKA